MKGRYLLFILVEGVNVIFRFYGYFFKYSTNSKDIFEFFLKKLKDINGTF